MEVSVMDRSEVSGQGNYLSSLLKKVDWTAEYVVAEGSLWVDGMESGHRSNHSIGL
ncbi:uncharacterized protein PGTG_22026 [Puccinia graminis f. sp. tritici CRL 75-36-700-3]|uniref:Uncharacterized protein n=1 Tax=Puccinia graminis f. sp. tritici (strain CRL 75-36-700-3 / race SCCL) TaxID=418459 RepID=H6QTB4_PUCGT|nr:uncharacterized protein PGTG_22026 [Puccinia graminis f. sp. tritici CRL 75-36-700-3]EHS64068.1 hypothetical protein PGTG_22026 [Puccinia graminis f. sp. tritici CRL 75-36-700-3]